jgi:lipid II:glycine glycyltransferase (peptidoglycan interpeptide bridge formation enzyme)
MTDTLSVERISGHKWDELAPTFRDASYRQFSSYAAAAARQVGAKSELNRLMENQCLIGLADVRVKKIPMARLGIAYASYAPIIMRDERFCEKQFGRCLDALRQEYVDRRGFVLRVTPALNGGLFQDIQASCLKDRGFHPSSQQPARKTFVLDLLRPIDEIRRSFDPKWRSDLTRAEKAGIRITRSVELSDFDHFERIFSDLTKQKGFMPNQDVHFFRRVQSNTQHDQKFVLHLAWRGDELIAGHLGSFVGDTAIYLLGAASSTGRDLRASYLLQWSAITYGKATGNSFYDLGGIDEKKNPDVYRFKRRLSGRLVTEIGPYEIAPGPVSGRIVRLAENARNAVKGRFQNGF